MALVTPIFAVSSLLSAIFAITSYARYGLIADAPKPSRSAMCITSRASPVSTIIAELVRICFCIKCLLTAETARRAGIGVVSAGRLRSLKMSSFTPLATQVSAFSHKSVIAFSSSAPEPPSGNLISRVSHLKSAIFRVFMRSKSSLDRIG